MSGGPKIEIREVAGSPEPLVVRTINGSAVGVSSLDRFTSNRSYHLTQKRLREGVQEGDVTEKEANETLEALGSPLRV